MKKFNLIIIGLLLFTAGQSHGQKYYFKHAIFKNGYWGDWKSSELYFSGSWKEFVLYPSGRHPANYSIKVTISPKSYDRKTIRYMKKNKQWFEYPAIIEYYVCTGVWKCEHPRCVKTDDDHYLEVYFYLTGFARYKSERDTEMKFYPATVRMSRPLEESGNRTLNIYFKDHNHNEVGFGIGSLQQSTI